MSDSNNGLTVQLMYGSSSFAPTTLPTNVTTLGHLKEHIGWSSSSTVNVAGRVVTDDSTELTDGVYIAVVSKDKTGG
mgnify:CR=1 FL=1